MVLSIHVALVIFIVGGLVLIIVGNFVAWRWVNVWWLRVAHLAAIGIVAAESWIKVICPLTSLEMWLRMRARETTYASNFIEHWLQRILYYQAPAWVFTFAYSLFALLVVATWWYFPPRRHTR